MTDMSGSMSMSKMIDDIIREAERRDAAEERLAQAHRDQPLACVLVMAAHTWERVKRGWRTPQALCAQARLLMTNWQVPAWRISVESLDDADQVASALKWATQDPALLERDDRGRYRPVIDIGFPIGSQHWREHHDEAEVSGRLTPLELIAEGDSARHRNLADFDAAEKPYRHAMDSDDPDAVAMASLRLAELAEEREQTDEAARRYADVAALKHPVASPPAVLWLARQAAQAGDRATARTLAHEALGSDDVSLLPVAWDLLASLAWLDGDKDGAVAAIRRAVALAGTWHWSYTRRLGTMLYACGDPGGAADAFRTLLDQPLLDGTDAGQYVQLMAAAGRLDEAVEVLEQHAAEVGPFSGNILLALGSAHAARDDLEATREVLTRIRADWSATMPQVSVPADVMEASLAAAEGDDDRAAYLFRSLTDTDDTERRDLARPLLLAAGERFAAEGKLCLIPGVRPLLEYLCEVAEPETATWAATSLAHLATVEDRPNDAEAAVRLAARHMKPYEAIVLRSVLLRRSGRDRDALAYLVDACVAAEPSTLAALLVMITAFGMCELPIDDQQRLRLRAAAEHALSESDGVRGDVAMALAQFELYICSEGERAIGLWELAAHSDDPTIMAQAWLNVGLMRLLSAPVAAAHAFEQAMLLNEEAPIGGRAAGELARLAERIGDDTVLARACERALDLAEGDDWAQAALRLGWINQYGHPDDAEVAYHAALAEPGARPATIGVALARLGALYALHGNRRLAQRTWRRGKNHRNPAVTWAFTEERKSIGRVSRIRNRTGLP